MAVLPFETQRTNVLIIDDEEPIRNLLAAILGNLYECHTASSAEEALTALATKKFDLVVSDIDMGGMSGLELVPRLHSLSPDTVVVMISGNQDIETAIAREKQLKGWSRAKKVMLIEKGNRRWEDLALSDAM